MQDLFPKRTQGVRGLLSYIKQVGAIRRDLRRNGRAQQLLEGEWAMPAQRRTCSLPYRFEGDFTQALSSKARGEETSVFGALAAALALSAAEDSRSGERIRLAFGAPVSLRDRLELQVDEHCGGFVSGAGTFLDLDSETPFWDLARCIKQRLSRSIRRDEPFVILPKAWGAYARVGQWLGWSTKGRSRFARLVEKVPPPRATLTHSSVGRLEIVHRHGPLTIESIGITRALSVLSTLGSTATTLNGVLYWHIEGVEPLLSRDRIRRIAERAMAILKQAVGSM